jgi:hypothetical protein
MKLNRKDLKLLWLKSWTRAKIYALWCKIWLVRGLLWLIEWYPLTLVVAGLIIYLSSLRVSYVVEDFILISTVKFPLANLIVGFGLMFFGAGILLYRDHKGRRC